MRYRRADVVDRAVEVLDAYGLPDLTMRRLGAELGVQPSALYHHFASKQALLAAVADEIVSRGPQPGVDAGAAWDVAVHDHASALRDAMTAYRDGAEVVATAFAFRLGGLRPYERLVRVLTSAGFDPGFAEPAARTVLHFVLGSVYDEQLHRQAGSAGAVDTDPFSTGATDSFELGLALIVDGIRARATVG